jgi:hypothetical protein
MSQERCGLDESGGGSISVSVCHWKSFPIPITIADSTREIKCQSTDRLMRGGQSVEGGIKRPLLPVPPLDWLQRLEENVS